MECGACGVQVRRSPAFGPTLRTNYGSCLSLFLATHLRGAVPAKMAYRRVGGQRVGWLFGINASQLGFQAQKCWKGLSRIEERPRGYLPVALYEACESSNKEYRQSPPQERLYPKPPA